MREGVLQGTAFPHASRRRCGGTSAGVVGATGVVVVVSGVVSSGPPMAAPPELAYLP